jgi:hypothetical protein
MQQLELFEPSNTDIQMNILKMEVAQDKLRKGLYAKCNDLQAGYTFLFAQMEILMDMLRDQGRE